MPQLNLNGVPDFALTILPLNVVTLWGGSIGMPGNPYLEVKELGDSLTSLEIPFGGPPTVGVFLRAEVQNYQSGEFASRPDLPASEFITGGTLNSLELVDKNLGYTLSMSDLDIDMEKLFNDSKTLQDDDIEYYLSIFENGWVLKGRQQDDLLDWKQADAQRFPWWDDIFFGDDVFFGKRGNDRIRLYDGDDVGKGGAGNDKIYGDDGNDFLVGENGRDKLWGGKGADVLEGGKGRDTLKGGLGADKFVFADGFGKDKIIGFAARNGKEDINLSAVTSIQDFEDLVNSHMSQVGDDVIIDAGGGDVICIIGTDIGKLDASDFIF